MDQLSYLVLECQNHPEDALLKKKVRDATMELFYRLPSQFHLLTEAQCAAFLLYCEPSIDRYIASYRPVATFRHFILSIVRRRVVPFLSQNHTYYIRLTADTLVSATEEVYRAESPTSGEIHTYSQDQLPAIYQTLMSQGPTKAKGASAHVRQLLVSLKNTQVRRGLLLTCALNPSQTLNGYIPLASKLLGCDEAMFEDFIASLDMLLYPKRQGYNDCLDRVGFRFFQINDYRRRMKGASPEDRQRLHTRYRHNLAIWRNTLSELQSIQKSSLSKAKISQLLHITHSTITHSIERWKRTLEETLDACKAKEYLE